jgi:hypothetical protein
MKFRLLIHTYLRQFEVPGGAGQREERLSLLGGVVDGNVPLVEELAHFVDITFVAGFYKRPEEKKCDQIKTCDCARSRFESLVGTREFSRSSTKTG